MLTQLNKKSNNKPTIYTHRIRSTCTLIYILNTLHVSNGTRPSGVRIENQLQICQPAEVKSTDDLSKWGIRNQPSTNT
jgi:hypothetical protein